MHESHHSGRSRGRLQHAFLKLFRDEGGGEALEYALIIGLVLVTAIAVVGSVGTKVLAR